MDKNIDDAAGATMEFLYDEAAGGYRVMVAPEHDPGAAILIEADVDDAEQFAKRVCRTIEQCLVWEEAMGYPLSESSGEDATDE